MKKLPSIVAVAVAAAAALGMAGAAQATLVTFNTPALIQVNPSTNEAIYSEANFKLSGLAATFGQLDNAGTGGTPGLYGLQGNSLALMSANGSLFNLTSFDFGALDNLTAVPPTSLSVQGVQANNILLTETLSLGALSSFSFTGWSGLAAVRFSSANGDFVLDNLNLQAVPEPASWALIGVALAGLGLSRRSAAARKKRQ